MERQSRLVSYWGMSCSYQKSWSDFSLALAERTSWRQQPEERCRKHIPWGEKLPRASESLFTTSCACYFHQNRALSFSPALFFVLLAGGCYCKAPTLLCSSAVKAWLSKWSRQERRHRWSEEQPWGRSQSSRGRGGNVLCHQFLS